MASPMQTYDPPSAPPSIGVKVEQVDYGFIGKLQGLKYEYRPDMAQADGRPAVSYQFLWDALGIRR